MSPNRIVWSTAIFVLALSSGGCGGAPIDYPLTGTSPVYTQVNLHPDEARRSLSSVNYQREGLIPVCSPVRIERVTRKRMTFTVLETNRTYTYVFFKGMRMTPEQHLDLVFGKECPRLLGSLSPLDEEGVRSGEVRPGMTRAGVIAAIGYPPDHATPDLAADVWKYWVHRYNTIEVRFHGDVVADIRQ